MSQSRSLRLGALVAPAVFLAVFLVVPPASAGSCSGGSGGDSPPEGRPYRTYAGSHPPEVRKYLALTTINADGVRDRCDCTQPRDWDWGMDPQAVASVKAAMDGKEALAIHNYGKFGVPPERVPMEARTIFFRTTWRSNAEQVCLRAKFGSGAALPGRSKHEWGMAVDLEDWGPQNAGVDIGFMQDNGWCRTVRSEPWHLEYRPLLERIGQGGRCIK